MNTVKELLNVKEDLLAELGSIIISRDALRTKMKAVANDKNKREKLEECNFGRMILEMLSQGGNSLNADTDVVGAAKKRWLIGVYRLTDLLRDRRGEGHKIDVNGTYKNYGEESELLKKIEFDVERIKIIDAGAENLTVIPMKDSVEECKGNVKKEKMDVAKKQIREALLGVWLAGMKPLCVWGADGKCYGVKEDNNRTTVGYIKKLNNVMAWRGDDRPPLEIKRCGGFYSRYGAVKCGLLGGEPYCYKSGCKKEYSPYLVNKPWEMYDGMLPLGSAGENASGYGNLKNRTSGHYLYYRNGKADANLDTVISVTPDYRWDDEKYQDENKEYIKHWEEKVGKELHVWGGSQVSAMFPLLDSAKIRKDGKMIRRPGEEGELKYDVTWVYMLDCDCWAFDMCKYQKEKNKELWPEMQVSQIPWKNVVGYVCVVRIHKKKYTDNGDIMICVPIWSMSRLNAGGLSKKHRVDYIGRYMKSFAPHATGWHMEGAHSKKVDVQDWLCTKEIIYEEKKVRINDLGGVEDRIGGMMVDDYIKYKWENSKLIYRPETYTLKFPV